MLLVYNLWPNIKNSSVQRRVVLAVCLVSTLLIISFLKESPRQSRLPDTSINDTQTSTLQRPRGHRFDVTTLAEVPPLNKLLAAVNKLSFKVMTPSSLLLEDFYFRPSPHLLVHYDRPVLHQPALLCDGSEFLLIVVPSHPTSAQQRRAIRETWGQVARGRSWPWKGQGQNYQVKLLFVLGTNVPAILTENENVFKTTRALKNENVFKTTRALKNNTSVTTRRSSYNSTIVQDALLAEISTYDDIVQFFLQDSYANLTSKIIHSLQWLVQSCPAARFILKADQDVFINIPLLATFLQQYGQPEVIYGNMYSSAKVARTGKWAVPFAVLPIHTYPVYAAGNAYVMSLDAAAKVVQLAPRFLYVSVEDAFITGILASVARINRVHVAGFAKWIEDRPDPCDFVNDRRYSGNNFTDFYLRQYWREIVDNGDGRCR